SYEGNSTTSFLHYSIHSHSPRSVTLYQGYRCIQYSPPTEEAPQAHPGGTGLRWWHRSSRGCAVAESAQDASPSRIELACQPDAFDAFPQGAVGMTELLERAVTERLESHVLACRVGEALLVRLNAEPEIEFGKLLCAAVLEHFAD